MFSFSATAPVHGDVLGPERQRRSVNTIAFNGSNCADAYIGGQFTSVNGTAVKNIAEVDTTTGNVVTAFGHSAGGQVETLLGVDGHILAGGYYTSINGSTADPYMTSLNPTTGKDDGFVQPEHLGQLPVPRRLQQRDQGLQPGSSATAARSTWSWATSPRSAGSPGSRSSC